MALEDVDTDEVPTDEELTALALAADPDAPIAEGAVPIGIHLAQLGSALPLWYMPPAAPGRSSLEGALRHRHRLRLPTDRSHGAVQHLRDSQLGVARRADADLSSRTQAQRQLSSQGFPAAVQLLTRASLIRRAVGMSAHVRNRAFSSSLSWE